MNTHSVKLTSIRPIEGGYFRCRFERRPYRTVAGGSRQSLFALTMLDDEKFIGQERVVATTWNFNGKALLAHFNIDASKIPAEGIDNLNVENDFTKMLGISVVESFDYEQVCASIGIKADKEEQVYAVKRWTDKDGSIHVFADEYGNPVYKLTSLVLKEKEEEKEVFLESGPRTATLQFPSLQAVNAHIVARNEVLAKMMRQSHEENSVQRTPTNVAQPASIFAS